ncbi:ABC transporter permease, partial [Streptomyces nanshensis]
MTASHPSAAPGPGAAAAGAAGRTRRRRPARAWLGALPLLVFAGLCFGLPAGALLYGAIT